MSKKVLCNDLQCQFKQRTRGTCKCKNECSLETADAIEFFSKYKVTTCEVGMGEEVIENEAETKYIIVKLRRLGRL